jgi:hypothetical protein
MGWRGQGVWSGKQISGDAAEEVKKLPFRPLGVAEDNHPGGGIDTGENRQVVVSLKDEFEVVKATWGNTEINGLKASSHQRFPFIR